MLRKSCSLARSLLESTPKNAAGAFVLQSTPYSSIERKLSYHPPPSIDPRQVSLTSNELRYMTATISLSQGHYQT